jgi:DNA polymerase III subunit delta'
VQFSEIIGQQEVKRHLAELVAHNRLSHALLFLGKEGSGTLPLAIAFAQYVVCDTINSRQADAFQGSGASLFGEADDQLIRFDSCGKCPACLKAQQLVHPDIHFSYPTVTRKPGEKPIATDFISEWRDFIRLNPYGNSFDWIEMIKEKDNSQGKITAEECNDIIRKLGLKSFESRYKILVLWLPEFLANEGNKLLKLVEEPPPNTLFILVTENESAVLPTLVSRCQLIRIPPLQTEEIEEALVSRNKTDPSLARQIAGVSDGNYREALQIGIHAEEDWLSLLREWLNAILKTGPVAQAKWVEEAGRLGREKQKQFLRYFNHLLAQAIRLRIIGPDLKIPEKERDFAERLNKIAGIEQQEAMIEQLDRASYYIERNAHGKMLFHALTIKLYHIIQNKIVFLAD